LNFCDSLIGDGGARGSARELKSSRSADQRVTKDFQQKIEITTRLQNDLLAEMPLFQTRKRRNSRDWGSKATFVKKRSGISTCLFAENKQLWNFYLRSRNIFINKVLGNQTDLIFAVGDRAQLGARISRSPRLWGPERSAHLDWFESLLGIQIGI
jgi:hypothetical protein